MKKVWVLEKFESREDMENLLAQTKDMLNFFASDTDGAKTCEQMVGTLEKKMESNPDGYWYGFEGKIVYKQFVECAKAAIRRNPDAKFRVVEGLIEDNATMWPGYKIAEVNDRVLRYLMATK